MKIHKLLVFSFFTLFLYSSAGLSHECSDLFEKNKFKEFNEQKMKPTDERETSLILVESAEIAKQKIKNASFLGAFFDSSNESGKDSILKITFLYREALSIEDMHAGKMVGDELTIAYEMASSKFVTELKSPDLPPTGTALFELDILKNVISFEEVISIVKLQKGDFILKSLALRNLPFHAVERNNSPVIYVITGEFKDKLFEIRLDGITGNLVD